MKHTELAELILDEVRLHGDVAGGQEPAGAVAAGEPEGARALHARVRDAARLPRARHRSSWTPIRASDGDRVSLMTLHAAKGLEFEHRVPAGLGGRPVPAPAQLDESGQAGLEEERRLAYVGLTRAKRIAKVSFAQNRRNRGLYQSALPSRFVDELPEAHVEVVEGKMPFGGALPAFGFGGAFGASRFDRTVRSRAVRGELRHARLAARPGAHRGARSGARRSRKRARAADHRGRARRRLERQRARLQARRARAAPEIRRRAR